MSNPIDDANKMVSDTPRTDEEYERLFEIYRNAERFHGPLCCAFENDMRLCRQLERELNAANDRIKRLHDGILKNNQEIEQTCGKVLGYPWFKDDQKNFPGSIENDGVCVGDHVAETIVSELAKRHREALARIKRLEEALRRIANQDYRGNRSTESQIAFDALKESKP